MRIAVDDVLALLLYPGLGLAIALAPLFGWLVAGRGPLALPRGFPALASVDGMAGVISILLAALALALLPWPFHPAAGWPWVAHPVALWIALESAFLAPVLPGLRAPSPLAARAAMREAQIGAAGRFVLWLALGAALWFGAGWAYIVLPGRVLAALAGLMALPAAAGVGPFAPERSLTPAGAEEGLDEATTGLLRFARTLRGAVVLAAFVVIMLPPVQPWAQQPLLQPWVALLLIAALFIVIALLLRYIAVALPRTTLPAALRWCWWRALPVAIAAMVYLIVI
jgi:hypothetical protein